MTPDGAASPADTIQKGVNTMTATADIFFGLMCLAGGSALSYFAGWLFGAAIDDVVRFVDFLRRFINGD